MIDRVIMLIDILGLSQKEFAQALKISQSTIATAKHRKSELSESTISSILAGYPTLNYRWLLWGEGEMWIDGKAPTGVKNYPLVGNQTNIIQEPQIVYETSQNRIALLEQENEGLKKEIKLLREMLEGKNEIIEMLKSKPK